MTDKAFVPPEDAEYGSVPPEDPEYGPPTDLDHKAMNVQLGAYSAVFVAMCGQVTITTPGGWSAVVHPLFILVLVIPLFMSQLTALMSLRADMVFSGDIAVATNTSDFEHIRDIKDPHIQTQVNLKPLMIIILSVVHFDYIMFTIQKIVFLINPYVWYDIHMRDVILSNTSVQWMAHLIRTVYTWKPCMMLPALVAMVFRFIITYIVIVDSIGIILTSTDVKDTIFNCLAIAFILEVNTMYWRVLHTIFHFMPAEVSEVKVPFNKNKGNRRWESCIVSSCAFFLGMRQVALVVYAIDTNTSPMTRDICTQWRLNHDMGSWSTFTKWLFDTFTWIDTSELIEKFVEDKYNHHETDFCHYKGKYSRTELSDMVEMAWKYPILFASMALVLFLVLIARDTPDHFPDILSVITPKAHRWTYRDVSVRPNGSESKRSAED